MAPPRKLLTEAEAKVVFHNYNPQNNCDYSQPTTAFACSTIIYSSCVSFLLCGNTQESQSVISELSAEKSLALAQSFFNVGQDGSASSTALLNIAHDLAEHSWKEPCIDINDHKCSGLRDEAGALVKSISNYIKSLEEF